MTLSVPAANAAYTTNLQNTTIGGFTGGSFFLDISSGDIVIAGDITTSDPLGSGITLLASGTITFDTSLATGANGPITLNTTNVGNITLAADTDLVFDISGGAINLIPGASQQLIVDMYSAGSALEFGGSGILTQAETATDVNLTAGGLTLGRSGFHTGSVTITDALNNGTIDLTLNGGFISQGASGIITTDLLTTNSIGGATLS